MSNGRKVLIICDNFPPQSGPRMGYLVKYMKRFGWSAWVVTAENKSRNDLTGLSGFAEEVHVIPPKPHRKWNLLHMLPFFWPYDYLRGEYEMRRRALELIARVEFDLVLTTHTFGYCFLSTAWCVARRAKLPLVIDIRDIEEQSPGKPFFQKSFNSKMDCLRSWCSFISNRRSACIHRKAAALTTISTWHTQWLKERYNPNTVCIFNGFDPELFKPIVPIRNERFEVVYTGTMGTPLIRDYEFLIQAVQRMAKRGQIAPDRFRVRFYCGPIVAENPIRRRVAELGIEDFCEFLDFVPLSEVPNIFARASCLLLLAAKSGPRGTHGIMTTKFFEYLAANRPILCVRSDEECLEAAIHETNAGCAARTLEEAEAYLLSLWSEWIEKGVTQGRTLANKLSLFSRETQARQFCELFDRVLAQKQGT